MRHETLVALSVALSAPARADDTHYNDYPVGGRAMGLGGAFTALANDPSGLFYNPAGIVDASRSSLSFSANLYGIQIAVGDDIFSAIGQRLAKIDTVFADLNIIPTSGGFVSAFGERDEHGRPRHSYGVGAFVPSYRLVNLQTTAPEGAQHVAYRRNQLDFTLHGAAAYAYRLDDTLRFGIAGVFNYRSLRDQEEAALFSPGAGAEGAAFHSVQTNLGMSVGSALLLFGIKASIADQWLIGAAVSTPNLRVYESSTLRIVRSSADPSAGASEFLLDEPDQIEASDERAASLRFGFAHVIPDTATFTGDLVIHTPVRFRLVEIQGEDAALQEAITLVTDIDRRAVANLNVGFEGLIDKDMSISFGFFTNFSAAPDIPGKIGDVLKRSYLPDVDAFGGSAVLGFFSEHTLTRIGLTMTYGSGEDVIPQNRELRPLGAGNDFKKISVANAFLYVFVSSTFRY